MTPATSVLLLTTLTGFGYGLIAWLGILAALSFLPPAPLFLPVAVLVGLGFANAGLIASTLHLGHPERAWRAFSQWRSSCSRAKASRHSVPSRRQSSSP
jgi:sulfite dehydrogenase (quinone) subunit SoeC